MTEQEIKEYEALKIMRDTLKKFIMVGYDIDDPHHKGSKDPQMVVLAAMVQGKPTILTHSEDPKVVDAFYKHWRIR